MRLWVLFLTAASLACNGCSNEPPDNIAASDADHEVGDAGDVDDADMALPDPPRNLAPCDATACRAGRLGGPPCSEFTQTDDFSSGEFGVHAYSSMVWDGAQTRIDVTADAGDWTPVIVLARENGEVLFDGDVGAVRPPFNVVAVGPGSIVVSTVQATGVVVYVTSVEALESNFATQVPANAAYTLTINSDCGERVRCWIAGRAIGDPECGWLHYVARRVLLRLPGTADDQFAAASRVAWWSLRQGRMSEADDNPIGRSECGGSMVAPLDTCSSGPWIVGLAGADAFGQDVMAVEDLGTRLYDGATTNGILRTTANEAGLGNDEVAAIMASTGALRTSWLLRNSPIGFAIHEPWVTQMCIDAAVPDATAAGCFGSDSVNGRLFASDRETALRSISDLHALFDQMLQAQ